MTPIKEALGGNARVANMLAREEIHTMEALCELRQTLGEEKFEERMTYIRNFGKDAMALVYKAMAGHEENPPAKEESSESPLLGSLPEGLLVRLKSTLQHLVDLGTKSDHCLVPGVVESPSALGKTDGGSLTAGDLEALAHLLTGVRWDLDLEEYRMRNKE